MLKLNIIAYTNCINYQDSNTTLVKVKFTFFASLTKMYIIQIQHLLKLNRMFKDTKKDRPRIQIQHLLKLNQVMPMN